MKNTLKALTVASGLTIAMAPQVASAKDATSSEVISICSKKQKLANREEKIFFMDAFKEIKYAVKNTKNPNIEVIVLPDTDGNESESSNVEPEVKKGNTVLLIPLKIPVDIDGKTYNGIHIGYGQSIGLFDSGFYNKKQDNIGTFGKVGFPAMRFTFFPSDTSGNSLCQKQRYYDKIDGYNFKTLEIQGRSIKFDLGEFKELIEVALEELRR